MLGGRFVIDEIELQEYLFRSLTPMPSLNGVGNQALLGKQLPVVFFCLQNIMKNAKYWDYCMIKNLVSNSDITEWRVPYPKGKVSQKTKVFVENRQVNGTSVFRYKI